ncbi:MAG: baseplate J/gp47 family protein [Afipia sp.]|nr:baseplate J/gp47 family protein [Afipia sp.]
MFRIETLKELVERARRAFRSNLSGSDAWLWPNNINPTAKVIGGMTHEVFGFMDYIQRQKFALTADGENLDLHGEEFGLSRRPTAPARGFVTVTSPGAVTFAVASIFRRSDGVEYKATAGGSLPGAGVVEIEVISTTEGKITSAIAGTPLEIVSGLTGDNTATAEVSTDAITGGADIEPDGAPFTSDLGTFRGRILFRKRNPPHGGAAHDYVQWASDVSGVTRVFVERLWAGVGTVRVFLLMDDLFANGVPDGANIARVAQYIETVRPAGALVTISPPAARVIDVTIAGLAPNTTDVQEAVIAELRAMFRRLSRVAGGDTAIGGMPYLASPATFSRSWIWQAIANASGEERHALIAPAADVTLEIGEMPTLGNVAFI